MIAGVVPCAGASERMGRPKALMEVGGTTFVRAVVDALAEGGCDPVVVVVPEHPDIEGAARATNAHVVVNRDPADGPISSLRLALAELDPSVEGVFYLPVDHPLVRSDTISRLVRIATESSAPLVIPTHLGSRGHPGFFRAELFVELNDPDLAGGARTVVHRHLADAELVPVDDPGVVTDIDTPGSYAAALQGGTVLS